MSIKLSIEPKTFLWTKLRSLGMSSSHLLLHKTIRWSKLERFIFVLETAHQYFYIFRNYLSAKLPVKFVYRTLERGWKKKTASHRSFYSETAKKERMWLSRSLSDFVVDSHFQACDDLSHIFSTKPFNGLKEKPRH